MAKSIILGEFSGGLGFGWGKTTEAIRHNKSVAQNQIVSGYSNPFIFDKMIVPGITRSGVVTSALAVLTQNHFPIAVIARDDNIIDTTSGVTVYFATNRNLHKIDPTLDTINFTPIDIYASANDHALGATATQTVNNMEGKVDSLINYQINGVKMMLIWYRTTNGTNSIGDFSTLTHDGFNNVVQHDTVTGASVGMVAGIIDNTHHILTVVSDNGYCYFGNANKLHKLDGTTDGGALGTVTPNVLVFSKSTVMVDMADMNGKLYIATKTPSTNVVGSLNAAWKNKPSGIKPRRCEVVAWNRNSNIVSIQDVITLNDCADIYNIYSSGNRLFIWVSNSRGIYELRELINGRFEVVAEIGRQVSFTETQRPTYSPACKTAIADFQSGIVWQADNGDIFWYGKTIGDVRDALHRIGQNTVSTTDEVGFILPLQNGKLYAGYFSDAGSGIDISVFKFNDTLQTAVATTIYTAPIELPKLSTVNGITLYFDDTTGNVDTGTTTLNIYNSYSKTTAPNKVSKTIDHDVDLARGWLYIPVNMINSNIIQLGLTYPSGKTLSVLPKIHRIEIDYTPQNKLL